MFKKSTVYKALRVSNDINAIKKGKIGKRVGRRITGKASGKALKRLFK